MKVLAPVSVGELLDKITILEIKNQRCADTVQLVNIQRELSQLRAIAATLAMPGDVVTLQQQLKQVNEELWDIEDFKRGCERRQEFNDAFVQAARQVYVKNDLRARIKREINHICHSDIIEEKIY